MIVITRHGCRSNRKQRAPEAIAYSMELLLWDYLTYRVNGWHNAERAVVVKRKISVIRGRVMPRDDKHRKALFRKIAD